MKFTTIPKRIAQCFVVILGTSFGVGIVMEFGGIVLDAPSWVVNVGAALALFPIIVCAVVAVIAGVFCLVTEVIPNLEETIVKQEESKKEKTP